MTPFLEELAARRRFGMKPGLETIRALCDALGNPQRKFAAIHVAGTNGKGAVCAILDAALREGIRDRGSGIRDQGSGIRVGRYTSPHLVKINERFFVDGAPVSDALLEDASARVAALIPDPRSLIPEPTFFEALTAVAFLLYAEAKVDYAILECGLGGRLDATNICEPKLCVITKIGLDHCDWLGDTVEKIAAEKAGIIKPGVPVVLGRNEPSVRAVIEAKAKEVGAPFYYAPDLASEDEIPKDFSLVGSFNRENAVTALAALKVIEPSNNRTIEQFSRVIWPGRFQRVGNFIVDGAHNPPAARALREGLEGLGGLGGLEHSKLRSTKPPKHLNLVFGACGDKNVGEVLSILAPLVKKGYAVKTNNPRSLSAEETAAKMRDAGIEATACASLKEALAAASGDSKRTTTSGATVLVCGSLFLAGEALVELGAYPWGASRFDPAELLRV